MPKASPLGNLMYERQNASLVGATDFYSDLNAHGELHPAPGPTPRSELELRIDGLTSDTPHSEYTGGMTS